MNRAFPILAVLTAALLSYGLYQALWAAPAIDVPVAPGADPAVMSNIFRIFYYHVSSAWTAFLLFFVNFIASVQYLTRPRKWADRLAAGFALSSAAGGAIATVVLWGPQGTKAISYVITGLLAAAIYFVIRLGFSEGAMDALALSTAEVGVVFCTVVLVTGPIWARPVWGIWWTWDPRLTSTLVLWLIYVSYLMLRRFSSSGQAPLLAAALAIFGFVDVPFVYLSIRYFNTQHPKPVIGGGEGSGIHPEMLYALLVNFAAFLCFAFLVCWSRYHLERVQREVEETQALEALVEPRGSR